MNRYRSRRYLLAARQTADNHIRSIARLPAENPHPVLRVTGKGMLLYANRAADELLNHWHCRVGGTVPAAVLHELAPALESGERRGLEVPLGERIHLAVLAPFPEKKYVNMYFVDITERKQIDNELRRLLDQLDTLVQERTAEIANRNARLIVEIDERKRAEMALQSYARRLIEMEEDLRRKLAAELHDEFGRDLTALGLNFTILSNSLSRESREKLGERMDDTAGLIEDMGRNLRRLMFMLRPPVLDDYGLAAALSWHIDLFGKRTGIQVDFRAMDELPRLSEPIELALYRIAHEALTNVSKHAEATRVSVRLAGGNGRVELTVSDNGKGFDVRAVTRLRPDAGWGLTIMRERAEAVGAHFKLHSEPCRGTVITVELEEAS